MEINLSKEEVKALMEMIDNVPAKRSALIFLNSIYEKLDKALK